MYKTPEGDVSVRATMASWKIEANTTWHNASSYHLLPNRLCQRVHGPVTDRLWLDSYHFSLSTCIWTVTTQTLSSHLIISRERLWQELSESSKAREDDGTVVQWFHTFLGSR